MISLEEYLTLFGKSYHEIGADGLLDVSYQLYDPDFKRRNASLGNWQVTGNLGTETATDGHSLARVGYDQQIKWIENGNFTSEYYGDVAPNLARYMGVEIKEKDEATGVATGKFYETIKLTKPGWYTIKCAGFTTRNSKLYARYNYTNGNDGTTVTHDLHPLSQDEYNRYSATVLEWPLSGGKQAYNAFALMNDDNLQGDDQTYHKNFNSQEVKFFITSEMLQNYSDGVPVEFGIEVDHTSKSAANEALTFNANYAKTMFDNFHLLYGGNAGNPDLILDENKTNLDYLDNTMHSYRSYTEGNSTQNTKMHLRRTFKANEWNSIILPVGLNHDQFVQAFGSKTKLAKLSTLTKNEILFKTVSDNHDYAYTDKDGNHTVQYFLDPMTPYIIKFADSNIVNGSDDNDTEENGYTSRLYYWSKLKPGNDAYIDVNIPKGTPCFTVDNINLLPGVVKTAAIPEGSSDEEKAAIDFKWDFADMKESVNSQDGSAYNVKKDCPYVVKGQTTVASTDRDGNTITMTAYGLLAMNVEVDNDGNFILNNNIPTLGENRPSMADSYIMQNNALTYKNSKQWNASKAFRCWFEYSKAKPTSQAKPTLLLDGVNMTTGIDNIMDNDEGITPIDQYKKGIFNLGGQLLSKDSADFDKLPKGIYIVDGKKVTKE